MIVKWSIDSLCICIVSSFSRQLWKGNGPNLIFSGFLGGKQRNLRFFSTPQIDGAIWSKMHIQIHLSIEELTQLSDHKKRRKLGLYRSTFDGGKGEYPFPSGPLPPDGISRGNESFPSSKKYIRIFLVNF